MASPDKLAETHDRLVAAVEALTSGPEWRRMLDTARQFPTYSFGNVVLIAQQRPDATRVAGFNTWKKLGRSVCKGEHGIAIMAPVVYRGRPVDEHDDAHHPDLAKVLRGFRVVHVFDISQTEGAPLDEVAPVMLEGDAPESLWDRLAARITDLGFSLRRRECGVAYGQTDHSIREVVVRPDLPPAQAAKTLCHELAHVLMHENLVGGANCRGIAEIEAESVAYLVCRAAGLATDDYAFAYVAQWAAGDVSAIRSTAERVIDTARQVLEAIGLEL